MALEVDSGEAAKADEGVVATASTGDGMEAMVVADGNCLRATVAERVVGGVRKPNKDGTHTTCFKESVANVVQPPSLVPQDDKYKVLGFDLEYSGAHDGHDHMVLVAQLCMVHHVLIYHYSLAIRLFKHFDRIINSHDYRFAKVDTTNLLKVLNTSGLAFQKLINIQGQYRV
ncbi:Serine/threonine-protein kinase [Hordeum vulgare]|nr:Serine/threonine-protein kinase [Hordeum vulgare]